MLTNEYYIWGAGTYGSRLIDFMKNDLSFKAVIDNDINKQGTMFHGLPIVSYDEIKKYLPFMKIVLAINVPTEVRAFLLKEGLIEDIDFFIIHNFIPRYFWAKNKTLVAKAADFSVTTACNLKCNACQTYIHVAAHHKHRSHENILRDIDLMFTHIDLIMNFNMCVGESLLNKKLPGICSYVYQNFADRYRYLTVQTNGGVIPTDDEMRCFSAAKTIFCLSSYPELKNSRKLFSDKCNDFGIDWYLNGTGNRNAWFDCGDPRFVHESQSEKLCNLFAKCWKPRSAICDGNLYLCGEQAWSHLVAEVGALELGDAFDLRQPKTEVSRNELYKILTGQAKRGYISHCARCDSVITPYRKT